MATRPWLTTARRRKAARWSSSTAPTAGTATLVQLQGADVCAGEVWTIMLDDGTFVTTHAHVVQPGESVAAVARALANNIMASGTVTFPASAEGDTLIVVNLAN